MKRKYRRKLFLIIAVIKDFFNNIKLPLGISVIFVLLFLFKPVLPNILGIKNNSSAITLLSVIAGALASILGIIIAVILVAFEILRKTYTTYAFKSFFQNKRLRELFILYISTIIVSMSTIASLSDPLKPHDISFIHVSFLFFITSILILFSYSRRIISSTQSKERIIELVNQIDYQVINSFKYFRPHVPPSIYISAIEDNPIFILSEVAIRTLKDDDRLTPKLVLVEATNKLLKMLEVHGDRRTTINAFLIIFRNTARQAVQSQQEGTLRTILDCIESIHSFCAEKQVPWNEVIELNEILSEVLEESVKAGLDETGKVGFYIIEHIMKKHLEKNVPKEDEIWTLHIRTGKEVPVDHDKSLQWEHVSMGYIGMISNLIETSIELKRGQVVSTGLHRLISIASKVIDNKLGDIQKADIIRWSYYYAKTLALKCVDEDLYKKVIGLSPFNFIAIDRALEKKTIFSKDPLLQFSEFLLQLAHKNSLDIFILNVLGTVGRGAVHKLDDDNIYKESLLFIIKVFNRLKEIIDADLSEEKRRIYLEIHSQTESLKKWMEQHNKKDQEIENNLNSTLSRFDKLETLKKEQSEGIIKWPSSQKNESGEKL